MRSYGPVPSRRLGSSLGVNNIPPKVCTYSCVYCQLGKTLKMQVEQEEFYEVEKIKTDVEKKVREAREKKENIDYISFVPDGEPTLDVSLGKEIDILKPLGIRIAVITNASLLRLENVRNDLLKADWVSLKVDAATEEIWRRVNRPHKSLEFKKVLKGLDDFAEIFSGKLATETMLIKGINDDEKEIKKIVKVLTNLEPDEAYVSIPTRPPAEKWVNPADEKTINKAYQIFDKRLGKVEYLIGYEGNAFASTGDVEDDLLSITSVHPMREEGVRSFLSRAGSDWSIIEKLIDQDKLVQIEYQGKKFYMRRLSEGEK